MRTLVLYYSWTGETERAATQLAQAIGADLEALTEMKPRRGIFGALRASWESLTGRCPELTPLKVAPKNYDLLVLGTPVWASRVSSPMRAFLTEQKGRFKHTATFCTQMGSGGEKVLEQMERLIGAPPVAAVVLSQDEEGSGARQSALDDYVVKLRAFIEDTRTIRAIASL